ncbi:uncharacterized protein LOC132196306 [Neocloeon triangulifer]|uniref:uncharacterized protein LOC132196306 n=1 Tax=Neocloeon triangulifer TaxID=2078957 RepID=UPI00286ECF52|nr:uncharacterized protein LOC132196306 [Neocloeon triangulifer]
MAKPRAANCKHPHRNFTTNGLYQHISPPRAVPALKPEALRQWLKEGDVERLRQLVTDGQGHRLLGERPPVPAARGFLRTLPSLMARQEEVHIAAEDGKANEVAAMLEKGDEGARLAISKDAAGLGLLHKAVLRGHVALAELLVEKYPLTINLRDHEGRTPLHYCGASPEANFMWGLLEAAGADLDVVDRRGNKARHYLNMSKNASGSSLGSLKRVRRQEPDLPVIVTRAHIRKWIHERDLGKLEKLLWAGHGDRLLLETSASPKVRGFLESVPYILTVIKEAHCAAVTDNIQLWRLRTSPPVPEHVVISKDKNGLAPLHKAAGLGHVDIVHEILTRFPDAHKATDETKRTPLHYAALLKTDGPTYRALMDAGADENAPDKKGHTPLFYAQHPHDHIDSSLLTHVPEAPRAHSKLPTSWNWNLLTLAPNAIATNMVPEPLPLPQLPKRAEKAPLPNIKRQPPKPVQPKNESSKELDLKQSQNKIAKNLLDSSETKFSAYQPQIPKKKPILDNSSSKISAESPHKPLETSGGKFNNLPSSPIKPIDTSGGKFNLPSSPIKPTDSSGGKFNLPSSPVKPLETSGGKFNLPSSPKKILDQSGSRLNTSLVQTSPMRVYDSSGTRIISTPSVYVSRQPLSTIPLAATAFPSSRDFDIAQTPPTTFSFSPSTSNRTPLGISRINTPFNPNITRPRFNPPVPPSTAPASTPNQSAFATTTVPSTAPSVTTSTVNKPSEGVKERVEVIPETPPLERVQNLATDEELLQKELEMIEKEEQVGARLPEKAEAELKKEDLASDKPVRPISPPGTRMHAPLIEKWVNNVDMARLEDALLEGRGQRVLKIISNSPKSGDFKGFVARAPGFMEAMKLIHSAARTGNLDQLNELVGVYKRIALARDEEGAQPLHAAVRAGNEDVALRILEIFPQGASVPDWEGRTPLHYAAMCPDIERGISCYQLLLAHGAPENAKDATGNTARDYLEETQSQVQNYDEVVNTQDAIVKVAEENSAITQSLPPKPSKVDAVLEEAKRLVAEQNTEKLAEMVLDGHGEKLLGLHSTNPYVQGLLENVPEYMSKIKKVHEAAETGDMVALQKALERRKFVTSRDKYGATPLHKAVLHQQMTVVRYLASRFPESLKAQDQAGRTALHYSAVLPDRGSVYGILASLGADVNIRDMRGHTALDYQLHHEQKRNHAQLLLELGGDPNLAALDPMDPTATLATSAAGALTMDMLEPDPRDMTFGTEPSLVKNSLPPVTAHFDGKALQEPLVEALKEVSKKRPQNPISYLANILHQYANKSAKSDAKKLNALLDSLEQVASPNQYNYPSEVTKLLLFSQQESGGVKTPEVGPPVPFSPSEEADEEDNGRLTAPPMPQSRDRRLETAGSMTSGVGSTNRDEYGQSMLHFAAVRSHSRNAFAQILKEAGLSVGQRDMVYRTPRDVALEAGLPENARDIDEWVLHLAMEGDTTRLEELLLDGYDHILDIANSRGVGIIDLVTHANVQESAAFLNSISAFESRRDWIHSAIRSGDLGKVREVLNSSRLAVARNKFGRCALHVAVLTEQEKIVEFIAIKFPICLAAGDNLERTALHYAMAMDDAEKLSMILVKAGAKRVTKDLKGRQPSFYFVNREEIISLKEEEMREVHGVVA